MHSVSILEVILLFWGALLFWADNKTTQEMRTLRRRVDHLEMKAAGLMTLDEANRTKGFEIK